MPKWVINRDKLTCWLDVTSLIISRDRALVHSCLHHRQSPTRVCLPRTTYVVVCVAAGLMRQLGAPLPDLSGHMTTLMSSCCLSALCSRLWGPQAIVYSLSGERESCLAIPKFLSESVQSRFFPLLFPEHAVRSWKAISWDTLTWLFPVYSVANGNYMTKTS